MRHQDHGSSLGCAKVTLACTRNKEQIAWIQLLLAIAWPMRVYTLASAIIIVVLVGSSGHATWADCRQEFVEGQPPVLLNPKLAGNSYPLCFSGFATLFSGLTRTPIYSAEHLTADRIGTARAMVRVNRFHAEPRLPDDVRSELDDFRGSGFDRGHMAPNGDMGEALSQSDSFSLANMVPQNHANNAGLWAAIEEATRDTAVSDGDVYVVTGPLFQGADLNLLNGRVFVPTGLWKAVYDPVSGEAGAYVADNAPGWLYRTVSIATLASLTGVDPFPVLSSATKAAAPDLPSVGNRRTAEDRRDSQWLTR